MRLLYNVNIHLFTQYTKINEMTDYFLLIASWLNHLWVEEGRSRGAYNNPENGL